jgi:hypothetical protein
MKISKRLWVTVALSCLGLSLPCAANDTDSGTFQTTNQSMWSSGNTFNFTDNRNLIDLSLAGSSSVLGVINLNSTGDVGVSTSLNVNGGTVSAAIPISVGEGFPTSPVPEGSPINVSSSGMFGVGSLSTASPNIQASANLFANNVSASISGLGLGIGVGPFTGSANIFSIDTRTHPTGTFTLSPGITLTVGAPFVATSGSGGPQTFPPPLNLSSSGGPSSALGLNANLTNLAAAAFGLPPLSGSIDLPPCIPIAGCAGSLSYNLLSISAGLSVGGTQSFNLASTPEVAYTVVEAGAHPTSFTSAMMNVGTPFSFTFASGDNNASVTPTYFLSADLTNNTGVELDANAGLSALGGSISYLGASASLGPLININTTAPVANLSVFDSTFALGGWNSFEGQTFEVSQTPEPGTLILFGSGLLALASCVRRRKSNGVVAPI